MSDAIAQLRAWIRNRENGRYVAVTGMHGVAESRQDGYFRKILNTADLVVPDGMPLVWLGRWHRYSTPQARHRIRTDGNVSAVKPDLHSATSFTEARLG